MDSTYSVVLLTFKLVVDFVGLALLHLELVVRFFEFVLLFCGYMIKILVFVHFVFDLVIII